MPVNILLTYTIGTTLGWLFMKITKAPPAMQGLMLGSCAAGGSLRFKIVNGLIRLSQCSVNNIFVR